MKITRNLIKESVKEAIREETTSNFYAFWSLANSQNVGVDDDFRILRKEKPALESKGENSVSNSYRRVMQVSAEV